MRFKELIYSSNDNSPADKAGFFILFASDANDFADKF
jgi:hypothetical protein